MTFRNDFGRMIFRQKYQHPGCECWEDLAHQVVEDVCRGQLPESVCDDIEDEIVQMRFIPAGRYLYYAGRPVRYWNNCVSLATSDTREGWADLVWRVTSSLMCGAGVGVAYSNIRPSGSRLGRTGGTASGPLNLMLMINEIGRNVMQGGSRRSAMWAGLNWNHRDIRQFMQAKLWSEELRLAKALDFNSHAPLDMTNISVGYDGLWHYNYAWGVREARDIFRTNVELAMQYGEPGFSFNIMDNEGTRTRRNACTEFISDLDDDVCNLASVNLSRIQNLDQLHKTTWLAAAFLTAGGNRAELPYNRLYRSRQDHPKIGVGLMGLHEWFLQRGLPYAPSKELGGWLGHWRHASYYGAKYAADLLGVRVPERTNAVAPAGTISLIAGTTSGIEPVFAHAMQRRYLVDGVDWKIETMLDPTVEYLVEERGIDPTSIETAGDMAEDVERRLAVQAQVQAHTDMGVSSTVNLPAWGTEFNNEDLVDDMAELLYGFSRQLRGVTFYPDGAIPGQVLEPVDYEMAKRRANGNGDFTDRQCKGGSCGI
jgi:ribonucleoside-diphosphate reductase alpha chain